MMNKIFIALLAILIAQSTALALTFTVSPTTVNFGTVQFTDPDYAAFGKFVQQTDYLLVVTNSSSAAWTLSLKTTGDFTRAEGGSWSITSNNLKVWGWYEWPQPPAGAWAYPNPTDASKLNSTALSTSDTALYRSGAGDANQDIKLGLQFGLWVPIDTAPQGNYSTQLTLTLTE